MPDHDIVLTTLNARYIHSAFGLRYLRANLGELRERSIIVEHTIQDAPADIAETLLAHSPKVIGLGVYIWNVEPIARLVAVLRRVAPQVALVVGGPEVSHEIDDQAWLDNVDYIVVGEGDLAFRDLARSICDSPWSRTPEEAPRVIRSPPPALDELALPYDEYSDDDVAHRVLYVEASRGCPFRCEFCLSALDAGARPFDLGPFLAALDRLFERGVRQFKFVDRTFNLRIKTSLEILGFFLERIEAGHELFVHFELIPDRLPPTLREILTRFPAGSLQFEVGIQTFTPEVASRIGRRQNYEKLADNFAFLTGETGVHIHADLIVGLPGESIAEIARGFDELVALGPQEIQVGILKRLRGAPIARHTESWGMIYEDEPPYALLASTALSFQEVQRLKRFSRYWDRCANSGHFRATLPRLWLSGSPFERFLAFSDWLYARFGRSHSIAMMKLLRALAEYLIQDLGQTPVDVAADLLRDYRRPGRPDTPKFLKDILVGSDQEVPAPTRSGSRPARQQRFLRTIETD